MGGDLEASFVVRIVSKEQFIETERVGEILAIVV